MDNQAVIYARVSTDEQAKGYSLQTQLDACRKYAAQREYTVAAEFSDDYTGAALDRPALNQLRDYLARNDVGVVVVYDLDRLARKSAYQVLIEEEFKRAGASIQFVMAQYEDSDEGRLQKQIRGVIAEYEKAKIMERSKRGKRGKAQGGFVLVGCRPPYGYKVKSEPHKAWLVIDDQEASVVNLIYRWYLDGDERGVPMSANAIATRLTKMGVPTRGDQQAHVAKKYGKGIWQRATVMRILTNETYTGTWYFGKTKMIEDGQHRDPKSKRGLGKQVARAREEWIPVAVPIIISSAVFVLAQKRKTQLQRLLAGHAKNEYLMKGRLTCVKCGHAMRGQAVNARSRNKKHFYYLCNGRYRPVPMCDVPAVRGDWVDIIVWDWVRSIVENPENLREGLRGIQAELLDKNQAVLDRLSIVDEQIGEHEAQLKRLLDLYLDGNFPKEVLSERKLRLEEMLLNLRKEHHDLASHLHSVTLSDDQMVAIQAFCARIGKGLDKADFNTRRQIVELLDVRGKVALENGEKRLYLKCLINSPEQQPLLPTQISPSLSIGGIGTTRSGCLPTDRSP